MRNSTSFIVAISPELLNIRDSIIVPDYTAISAKLFVILKSKYYIYLNERYNGHSILHQIVCDMKRQQPKQVRDVDNEYINNLLNEFTCLDADTFNKWLEKCDKDDYLYIFEYSEEDGPFGIMMERSQVFRGFKHLVIDNRKCL